MCGVGPRVRAQCRWCGVEHSGRGGRLRPRVEGCCVARVECRTKSERLCAARAKELVVESQVVDRKSRRSHGEGKKQQPCRAGNEPRGSGVERHRNGRHFLWSAATKSNGHHCGEGQRQRCHHGREAAGGKKRKRHKTVVNCWWTSTDDGLRIELSRLPPPWAHSGTKVHAYTFGYSCSAGRYVCTLTPHLTPSTALYRLGHTPLARDVSDYTVYDTRQLTSGPQRGAQRQADRPIGRRPHEQAGQGRRTSQDTLKPHTYNS